VAQGKLSLALNQSFAELGHPERSRFSGGAKDLACGGSKVSREIPRPLVKTRASG
jgi:hypothetical protein